MSEEKSASGVQRLIDRLSQEGVEEGQRQANDIVSDSKQRGDAILADAKRQAEEIVKSARAEAAQIEQAGKEALRLAERDSIREMQSRIHDRFREQLQRLVKNELQDSEVLGRLIQQIVASAVGGEDQPIEIMLPPEVISADEVRQQLRGDNEDALTAFVEGLIGESIQEGFQISVGDEEQVGLVVRYVNDDIEISFTEDALSRLLQRHLLPRFRVILHGS